MCHQVVASELHVAPLREQVLHVHSTHATQHASIKPIPMGNAQAEGELKPEEDEVADDHIGRVDDLKH